MDVMGDMARALVLRTNQVRLREEMDQLAVEVATGLVKDPAQHLSGDMTGLQAIDRSLAKLETFRVNTTEASFITSSMQTALDEIQSRSETLSQTLIAAELTPNSSLLNTMSGDADNALGQIMNGLNRSVGGRFLFSGAATDQQSLQPSSDLLSAARTALVGQTDMAGVDLVLDTFFGAGGTYETTTYTGSGNGLATMRLSETETAHVDIRASDDVFRNLLKPIVKATLATDLSLGFSKDLQVDMLKAAGEEIMSANQTLVEMRAGLGALEARIEETSTRNAAERTATRLARLDLVGADQYESAARYENIRVQLESLYAITARSQRLSLAEYL